MSATALATPRFPGAGIWDAMNVAAYVTWAAVACHPILHLLFGTPWIEAVEQAQPEPPQFAIGLAGMFAMLGLFITRALLDQRQLDLGSWRRRGSILGQAIAALVAYWALRDPFTPALLVIVAAQLGCGFPAAVTVSLLAVFNLVLTSLVLSAGGAGESIWVAAYVGFQAYAAIGANYGFRMYEAHLNASRINTELLAARQLVAEGARSEERLRVSRELHDIAGHKLTALKMQLALAAREVPAAQAQTLAGGERLAADLLEDIRGVVSALRQHEGVDLHEALQALDPRLPSPVIRFELDPDVRVSDMRQAEALLHSAQEGITNAMRHSGAESVLVKLARNAAGIVLTVEDDGRGRSTRLRPGNGLSGLTEWLNEVGGRLELQDRAPAGLTLRVLLPDAAVQHRSIEPPGAERDWLSYCRSHLRKHAENSAGG